MPSRDGLPFIITGGDNVSGCAALQRVSLTETPGENWLQQVLEQGPELLPLRDIDERIESPLISLGREITTPVGAIDNLFLSRNGYVVLVETKLWRNPEARRQVIAQVIDYAAHVRRWRYTELEQIVHNNGRNAGKTLWELVRPEDMEEQEWIDRVNQNLVHGRMCLIVAGDGIRSEVEALAEVVGGHPDVHFRLALVELRLFRLTDGRYLVVPATIAKTAEIERAVIRVEQGRVSVEAPTEKLRAGRRVLSEEVFLQELGSLPDGEQAAAVAGKLLEILRPPFQIQWRANSFNVKLPEPVSGRLLSLCSVGATGNLYAYLPWLQDQLKDLWRDHQAIAQVTEAHLRLLKKNGAQAAPGNRQYEIKLASLSGREAQFVDDLLGLARLVEKVAADESEAAATG